MPVRFFKALWGMPEPVPDAFVKLAKASYDGIEAVLRAMQAHRMALSESGLGYIALLFAETPEDLRRDVDAALELGAEKINVHAGKDFWSLDEGSRFFESCMPVVKNSPVPVVFETHRGRILYSPAVTAAYLLRFPEMRICADFSHFTCVCESMLNDQREAVALAISRTSHLHARVGHEEGPQVSDPRAPEWQGHVEQFEVWWDAILQAHKARGEVLTVDPEFGPPHYMPTVPGTGEPLADLWEVCLYVRDRLRNRWS